MTFTRRPHRELVHRSAFLDCTPPTVHALWTSLTEYEQCFIPILLYRLGTARRGGTARLDRLENNTLFRVVTAGPPHVRCALWEELSLLYNIRPARPVRNNQFLLPMSRLPRPSRRVLPPLDPE